MQRVLWVCLFLLFPFPVQAEQVSVVVAPLRVSGDYQPLNSQQTTEILTMQLEKHSQASYRILEMDGPYFLEDALEAARAAEADLIVWGSVRYRKASQGSRDPFTRGRLKLHVAAQANLNVAWVKGSH